MSSQSILNGVFIGVTIVIVCLTGSAAASVHDQTAVSSQDTVTTNERTDPSAITAAATGSISIVVNDSSNGRDTASTDITVESQQSGDVPQIPNVDQVIVNSIATKYGDSGLSGQDILFAWDDYQGSDSLEGVPSATGQDILFLWDGYQNLDN